MSIKSTQIGKLAIKNNIPHILTTSPTALTKLRIAASKRQNSAPKRDLSTIGLNPTYRLLGGRRSKIGLKKNKSSQVKAVLHSVRSFNNSSQSQANFKSKFFVREISDITGQTENMSTETAARPFNRQLYNAAMHIFNPKQSGSVSQSIDNLFANITANNIRDELMPIDKETKNLISVNKPQLLMKSENQGTKHTNGPRDPQADKELWSSRYQEYKPRMQNNWNMGSGIVNIGGGRITLSESSFENAKNIYNAAKTGPDSTSQARQRIPTCINHRINELFNKQHKQDVLAQRLSCTTNVGSTKKEVATDGNTKKQLQQQLWSGTKTNTVGDNLSSKLKTTQNPKFSIENRHAKMAVSEMEPIKAAFMRLISPTSVFSQKQRQVESKRALPRFDDIHYNNQLQPVTEIASSFSKNNKNLRDAQLKEALLVAKKKTATAKNTVLPIKNAETLQSQHQQQKKLSLLSDTIPNKVLDVSCIPIIQRESSHRMPVPNIRKHIKQTEDTPAASITAQARKHSTKPHMKREENQKDQRQKYNQASGPKNCVDQKQTSGLTVAKLERTLTSDSRTTISKQKTRDEAPQEITRSESYSGISGVHQILSKPEDSRFSHVRYMRDRKVW